MKLKFKCGMGTTGCMCKDCDNPLNILEEIGLNLEEVTQDPCLIQSIVSYKVGPNSEYRNTYTRGIFVELHYQSSKFF